MKCRNIVGAAGLTIVCFATGGEAQMLSDEPVIRPNVFAPAVNRADLKAEVPAPIRLKGSNEAKPLPSVRTHSMQFVILSAGVYGASFADMHETLKQRKYPWWYEADPGKTAGEATRTRLLRKRLRAGYRPELGQLENGALQKMAQAVGDSAIACD